MTSKQLFIIKSLFDTESRLSTRGGYCEVLHDAFPEDVAFMKQLIEEGSVVAYSTRSEGCGLPCYIFSGFTPKGRAMYEHITKKASNEVSNSDAKENKSDEHETPKA